MAWGSAKNNVRSKIASGSFQKKDTTIQDGLMRGAEIIASSWIKEGEEKRAEEKRQKAAAAAEARRLAAEQRKKEEEAKKRERQAKALAEDLGADPSNKEAIQYFTEQLYLFDDNSATVYNKAKDAVDIGKLSFVQKDDMRPLQGPDVPDSFQVAIPDGMGQMQDRFADGRPLTKGDLAGVAAGEMNDKPTRDAAAQMDEILAPVSQEPEQSVGTYQGIMLDPTAKPKIKLDASRLDTPESIELYLAEIEANGQSLDQNQQRIIDDRIKLLADRKNDATAKDQLDFRRGLVDKTDQALTSIVNSTDYSEAEKSSAKAILTSRPGTPFDITDYDDVDDATIQTLIDSKDTDPKKVTALSALLANRAAQGPKIDTGSADYQVVYIGEDGTKQTTIAKLSEDGRTFVDLSDPTKTVTPAPDTPPLNLDRNAELYDDVIKINQSLVKPLKQQRQDMATAIESAVKLDNLVNPAAGGDPNILTIVGGKLPQVITRIGLETNALVDLFNETKNAQDVLSRIDNQFTQYIENSNLTGQARLAALFQAEKIKLAFFIASASFGQANTGLSNKDFDHALDTIDQGSDYTTFTTNLRSQVGSVITKTERAIQDFNEDASIILLKPLDPTGQILDGYSQSAEEYATNRGLAEQFAWAKGKVAETEALPTITTKEERDALPVGTKYIDPQGNVRTKQ